MAASSRVHGIHHVTAFAGDPLENLHFYTGVLGLRLVKKSVNQDDPGTYHLFFADRVGTPGTDMTFFPWARAHPGKRGAGQVVDVPFVVPAASLDFWRERLSEEGVSVVDEEPFFGEASVRFTDPHGMAVVLVGSDAPRAFEAWNGSPVAAEHQIRGFHSVRTLVRSLDGSRRVLEDGLGFRHHGEQDGRHRFIVGDGNPGEIIDVIVDANAPSGSFGPGVVHHVAWRVADDDEELRVRGQIEDMGLGPTPPIDRFWFKSVYFREPGGVLYELATDGPGFERDEDMTALGEKLILPPWLEPKRAAIEAALPDLSSR
jgi:glyoxalase family protein